MCHWLYLRSMHMRLMLTTVLSLVLTVQLSKWWLPLSQFVRNGAWTVSSCQLTKLYQVLVWEQSLKHNVSWKKFWMTALTHVMLKLKSCHVVVIRNTSQSPSTPWLKSTSSLKMTILMKKWRWQTKLRKSWKTTALLYQQHVYVFQFCQLTQSQSILKQKKWHQLTKWKLLLQNSLVQFLKTTLLTKSTHKLLTL